MNVRLVLPLTGGTTAVLISPLEVLKTRLQTQKIVKGVAPKYAGGIHIYGVLHSKVSNCCADSSLCWDQDSHLASTKQSSLLNTVSPAVCVHQFTVVNCMRQYV